MIYTLGNILLWDWAEPLDYLALRPQILPIYLVVHFWVQEALGNVYAI